ncbi:MAG: hypothetical protein K8R48_08335 [Alphaproteobacteria bacterium]|nr:hypothetical protein [Alphaproteobacteria bacterium]
MANKKALLGISCVVLMALAGCANQGLNKEDRALLTDTHSMAEAAKNSAAAAASAAAQAAADAKAAREDADKAAKAAEAGAEKSDQIFRQQQAK